MKSICTARHTAGLLLWLLVRTGPSVTGETVEVVHPEFLNELKTDSSNLPSDQSSSMAFHGGNVGPYRAPALPSSEEGVVPQNGIQQLMESSFGQAFATEVPFPNFTRHAMTNAQAMLYVPTDWNRADAEGSDRVFRYKVLLFGTNGLGVAADASQMNQYFGAAERLKFDEAVKKMRDALKYAPYDRTLRNALLDAYDDLVAAEIQYAKADRAKIAEYRLGFQTIPVGGFVIDQEILWTTNLVGRYERALRRYGALLTDRMGVNLSEYDPALPAGLPLGAFIFQQEQPDRNQYAAQFYDTDGVLKTVPYYDPQLGLTTNTQPRRLFAGYKDYVNLVGLLREYTSSAAELARSYGMRGRREPGDDLLAAQSLIGRVQREAQLEALLLRGLFPDYEPDPADGSGLRAAQNGLGVALAELDNVRAFLDGRRNLLGFDPNFLVLIKEAPDGSSSQFDSYDALMFWIGARGAPSSITPLGYAQSRFEEAQDSYAVYQGNADEVWEQLDQITQTYADRYFAITGWDPGDTTTNHLVGAKASSELGQAHRNVELGEARVASIRDQAAKLRETIGEANWLIKLASSKSERLEQAKQNYFDATDSSWDGLHFWAGTMAASQATFDTVAAACTVDGIATIGTAGGTVAGIAFTGAANAMIQTAGAVATSMTQEELERAAADYEVAVMQLDVPAEIAQARIEYQDRLREQIALSLEMQDAAAIQAQEIARREALIRELERVKQQAEENTTDLADRYYADPVHYLRAQNHMILADEAFSAAQRWVFFTLRALEFKWNKDFAITWQGRDWDLSSLFKLRNYPELEQIVGAMEEFNRINLINFNREPFVDVISLRDDLMAPPAGSVHGRWLDVATGELVTSTNLLRRKLLRSVDGEGNLVIRLNTFALKKDTGFFFLGPRYRANGTVLSQGKYLDKIDWIKFNVVGSEIPGVRPAHLSYGGTCYIRTQVPPCGNPAEPFTLPGEYRVFPFFYFRTPDNGATWQTRKTQEDTVKVAYSLTPGEPAGEDLENRFLKERSVAATDWVLTLFAGNFDISKIDDIEIWVSHLFVTRELPDCN